MRTHVRVETGSSGQELVAREWRPGLQELCQVHSIAFQDELFVRF